MSELYVGYGVVVLLLLRLRGGCCVSLCGEMISRVNDG